ncbi:MAG: CapA family protein [Oscillospiraceae bacterium]|jgi:poly-gamma-glutamate synthesis protein (capsule biosynthesis protein)|nr:CapA family protein [Oscillospiraceae bacterium]
MKIKTLLALLSAAACCTAAACAVGAAPPQTAATDAELTDEFRDFLALREAAPAEAMSESAGGYDFTAENGRLRITGADETEVWSSNEEWYVDSFRLGDVNRDRISDVTFVVWKSYRFGAEHPARMTNDDASVRCHLYVYSVKDDRVKPLWCSSTLPRPIYSFELDAGGERTPVLSGTLLITQEGSYTGDYGKTASTGYTYEWNGWGFSPRAEPSPAVTPAVHSATLAVVGDLMCHKAQYADALAKGGGETYDFSYMFKYIAPYISAADYAVGNFETTITLPGNKPSDFPYFASPQSFAEAIKDAGFDFVTTVNNHSLDYGKEGLIHTLEVLDELGLRHTGTYAAESDSENITVIDVNGITFAILSYTYGTNGNPIPPDMPWSVNITDDGKIADDIAKAKALNPDFVIVMPHMGAEYETSTREIFKDNIRKMLLAGADIVLASHPHVLQPVEFVTVTDDDGTERRCFVAYSLGNFVSSQRTAPRDYGMIVNLGFSKTDGGKAALDSVGLTPVWVKFTNPRGAYDITVLPVIESGSAGFTNIINTGLRPGVAHSGDNELQAPELVTNAVPELAEVFDNIGAKGIRRIEAVKAEFAEMFPGFAGA